MIEHLSAEQISQWMIGERTPALERHVNDCVECRGELEKMESAISQFRAAMRDPATAVPAPEWRAPAPASVWHSFPRLALAAAAVIVLVAVPVTWRAHERREAAEAAQAALADAQLLESVDLAISQAVPEPMEPLVSLVSWNSNSTDQNQKAQRQ